MYYKEYDFNKGNFKTKLDNMGVLLDYGYVNGNKTRPKIFVSRDSVDEVKELIQDFHNFILDGDSNSSIPSGGVWIYFRIEKNTMAGH